MPLGAGAGEPSRGSISGRRRHDSALAATAAGAPPGQRRAREAAQVRRQGRLPAVGALQPVLAGAGKGCGGGGGKIYALHAPLLHGDDRKP
eukprot:scaffold12924_cov125-Isochrysis_galbana.AAC.19